MPAPPPRSPDATGDADRAVSEEGRSAAGAALREAFTRLQPQGSDAWNFLGAFTHLAELARPQHPGISGAPDETPGRPDESPGTPDQTPGASGQGSDEGPTVRRGIGPDRIRRFMNRGVEIELAKADLRQTRAELEQTRAELEQTRAELGQTNGEVEQSRARLEQAVAHVVEAFRFLSARVETLEARIAAEDHPIDGAAWLAPARELGAWVERIAAHVVDSTPGGDIVHADCGDGTLIAAIEASGVPTQGVEPRGDVAVHALEQGCRVTICEAFEHLSIRAQGSLGGIVLSGVVDRLPVAGVVPLLAQCRRTMAVGAPLVVVADPRGTEQTWEPQATDILDARPLHAATWEMLLERAGFAAVDPISAPTAAEGDSRLVVAAVAPS